VLGHTESETVGSPTRLDTHHERESPKEEILKLAQVVAEPEKMSAR